MDWWVSHAGTASVNFIYRIGTGCDHDTLLECATNGFTSGGELNCEPCRPGGKDSPIGGGEKAFMPGGALGYTTMAMQGMSETKPPFSLATYAKDLKRNTIIGGETYAQPAEWGVNALRAYYQDIFKETTLAFWKQSRNLAYLLLVVVLIAMGFMVMFRTRIDPRTTMTATSALPKIAVGLVLVTFSYPIVSLAVDLIFVLTAVARNLIISIWTEMAGPLGGLDPSDYTGIMAEILSLIAAVFNRRINLFSMIFFLVILGTIFLTFFLALWEWLKRFARLIVAGIFGPLVIAWGTIPGNGDLITGWFKGIIANVLALPAIFLVMNAGILVLLVNQQPAPDDLPLFFPIVTDLAGLSFQFIIGFMILWGAHKVPKAIDEALETASIWTGGRNEKKKK